MTHLIAGLLLLSSLQVEVQDNEVWLERDGRAKQLTHDGKSKLQAAGLHETCASILSIAWVGETGIGVECHFNPSLSEYVQTDLAAGQSTKDLGFDLPSLQPASPSSKPGWICPLIKSGRRAWPTRASTSSSPGSPGPPTPGKLA